MAHIYVGFHDQRSCNRILKPPGGGTSNIFGTDFVPDVVPQVSPQKDNKYGGTMQQLLQNETVTTTRTEERRRSSTHDGTTVEKVCPLDRDDESNGDLQDVALVTHDLSDDEQRNGNYTPDLAEVTSKVEHCRIEERSSKSQVTETDSFGHTKIISSDSNSEGSVEKSSSCKKGSSIEDILKQDDIEEKKKINKEPVRRVPPGGYSSVLW